MFKAYLGIFGVLFLLGLSLSWLDKENKYDWHLPSWIVAITISGMITTVFSFLYEGLYSWLLLPVFSFVGLIFLDERAKREYLSMKEEEYRAIRKKASRWKLDESLKRQEEEARRVLEKIKVKKIKPKKLKRKHIPNSLQDRILDVIDIDV